jgi:hypothetical protein
LIAIWDWIDWGSIPLGARWTEAELKPDAPESARRALDEFKRRMEQWPADKSED